MNLVMALLLFNFIIIMYQIIIEVFTMLYRINGISIERSKFQVISMLTGTGFTTEESELMLLTKKRRKLTQRIMFFGYIFNIFIVSVFINIFISYANSTFTEVKVGLIVTLWTIFFMTVFQRSRTLKKILDDFVMWISDRKEKKKENFISIYDTYGSKVIAEIELKNLRKDLSGKTIEESKIKQNYGINVLVIKRKEEIISEIYSDTVINEGDTIIVFGKIRDIKNVFKKKNVPKTVNIKK